MPLSHSSPPHPSSSASASSNSTLHCGDVVSCDPDTCAHDHPLRNSQPSDVGTVARLIDSEVHHMPPPDYLRRCRDRAIDVTARQDSINWILKVHAYYDFRPVTALLSVNYFDRFLSSHSLPLPNGWPFQLLSVACLSLAAKMEETEVPLLLDLQLFEPRFVFEPGTIQRMELRVMAALNWRLRSITPFDYLHNFISMLPSSSSQMPDPSSRVLSASSDLIIGTTRVIDFLGFTPSTIAAAAVLSAAGLNSRIQDAPDSFLHQYQSINRNMVRSCHQLMEEYLVDTCPSASLKNLRVEPQREPSSPVGVLDAAACGSCDTRSENPGSTSQAQPPAKRPRSSDPDVQQ
ncbi:hypothetical protein SLEP1_g30024 [Rubroshorea leprosula]|uniref:B-like cyclin n=1 Tax=Rubroshorea leprosula TaxID=152421 RepID=A0AAV5K4K9_9ROSI|nr:hypothetical protein SLEP1_g30024 [Rubroshorea leprosula]